MKGRTIILDHIQGREAAALMADGKLEDFLIESDAFGARHHLPRPRRPAGKGAGRHVPDHA